MDTDRSTEPTTPAAARRLAVIMFVGGSLHFLAPRWFDGIIPPVLPGRARTYTYLSGATALSIATGLAIPRTRRVAACFATAFFIGVMPAKLQLAANWMRSDAKSRRLKLLGIAQIFWQWPLIMESIKAGRASELDEANGREEADQPQQREIDRDGSRLA